MDITPIYRIEHYLDAWLNNTACPFDPIYRIEYYLAKLCGASVTLPTPIYRIEYYLAKLCGEDVAIPEPIYRIEYYLAKLCGEEVDIPEPIYRVEQWLHEMASDIAWSTFTGDIIQFNAPKAHELQSVVVDIEPQQDLNGQDNPYPSGGGKNKCLLDAETITKPSWYTGGWDGISLNNRNGINQTRGYQQGGAGGFTISGLSAGTYTFSMTFTGETSYCMLYVGSTTDGVDNAALVGNEDMRKSGTRYSYTFEVPSGSIQIVIRPTIYSATTEYALEDIQVEIGSSATSYAPYSNICPISGWTEVKVYLRGINMWDEEWEVGGINFSTGADWSTTDRIRSKGYISVSAETAYYMCAPDSTNINIVFYDADKVMLSTLYYYPSNHQAVTTPADCAYMRFSTQPTYGTTYNNDISINYPSTDTSYHAYQGNTYTIDLNGTRYGGTLTINEDGSGELTIEWVKAILDGSVSPKSANWRPTANNVGWLYDYADFPTVILTDTFKKPFVLCESVPTVSYSDAYSGTTNNAISVVANQGTNNYSFAVRNSDITLTTKTAVNTYLSQNPLTIAYKLATPLTVTLTAQQVTALVGTNTMWASTGDITAVARATAINLNGLQLMRTLLGGNYINNGTAEDISDEEAVSIILGGTE